MVKNVYLIASGHDSDHRELVNADLGDAYRGQESDLGGAHVGALSQYTLPTPDVMTYWPIVGQKCDGRDIRILLLFLEPKKSVKNVPHK